MLRRDPALPPHNSMTRASSALKVQEINMNKTITTVAALIAEPLLPAGEDTGRGNLSDNFGQSNCVILRESCKLADLHFFP